MLENKLLSKITQASIVVAWVIIITSTACTFKSQTNAQPVIAAVKLIHSLPGMDSLNNPVAHDYSMTVFQYKDRVMFEVFYTHVVNIININREGDYISDSVASITKKSRYVVYRKGAAYGLLFDSLNAMKGNKISVDSFLSHNTITSFDKFYKQKKTNDSLISIDTDRSTGVISEKYIPKTSLGLSTSDTTILRFDSNLKGYGYFLSKELDSLRNSKLTEVKIIFNAKPGNAIPFLRNNREMLFKLEKADIKNPDAVIRLMGKVEGDG